MQTYDLQGSADQGDSVNAEIEEWQEDFQDAMAGEVDNADLFNLYYFTERSIDDALAESLSGEIFLFITTCEKLPLPVQYVHGCLGRPRLGCRGGRAWRQSGRQISVYKRRHE